MEVIRYKRKNRSRIFSLIIHFVIVISISIALLILENYSKILLAAGLILMAQAIFFIIKGLLNRYTVIINNEGIYTNVNKMGIINWSFIEGFEIKKLKNISGIVVKINDNEGLLREMNPVSKALMSSNIKRLGSPVILPESEMDKPLEIVLAELNAYKTAYYI